MYTLGPAPTSTLRTIPFAIPTSAWTESNGIYTATFVSAYITETSKEMCTFDESLRNRAKRDINISKTSGGGSITLTTSALPTGAISGTIFTIDADDGKVCMVIEDTVLPIANGGTGANTLTGAKENLGISAIAEQVEELGSKLTVEQLENLPDKVTAFRIGKLVLVNFVGYRIETSGIDLQSINLPNANSDYNAVVSIASASVPAYLSIDNGTKFVLRNTQISALTAGNMYGTIAYFTED